MSLFIGRLWSISSISARHLVHLALYSCSWDFPTRDVLVQYIVLFNNIVQQFATRLVYDKDLPLLKVLGERCEALGWPGGSTSPRAVFRTVSIITV